MSEAPKLGTFVIFAPDCEGAVDLRLSARPEHLIGLKANIAAGFIKVGGIMVTEESRVAGSNIMVGSTLICKAESLEKVWEVVKADPYWKQGVWDKEQLRVVPILPSLNIPE